MRLGSGKKASLSVGVGVWDESQGLMAEEHLAVPARASATPAAAAPPSTDVSVEVGEELTVKLSRDGLIETVDVKGTLAVRVNNPDASKVLVRLNDFAAEGFQLQIHPTISRSFLADHVLTLKQAGRGFPGDSAVSVLRWRQPSGGDALLPLNVTCWPEAAEDGWTVNVEYTLNPEVLGALHNVRICVPLPAGMSPQIASIDGSYHYVGEGGGGES